MGLRVEGGSGGGGGGEANTASNVGASGAGVFKAKSGVDLQFRKVIGGAGVSATQNTDDVTLAAAVAEHNVTDANYTIAELAGTVFVHVDAPTTTRTVQLPTGVVTTGMRVIVTTRNIGRLGNVKVATQSGSGQTILGVTVSGGVYTMYFGHFANGPESLVMVFEFDATLAGWRLTSSASSDDTNVVGNTAGTFAARPAAGAFGRIYTPIDGGFQAIDDGARWLNLVEGITCDAPPAAAGLTQLGFGTTSAAIADAYGTLHFNCNSVTAATATLAVRSNPGALVVEASAVMQPGLATGGVDAPQWGIVFRDSVSSAFITLALGTECVSSATANFIIIGTWSALGTRSTSNVSYAVPVGGNVFLRMTFVSGNVHFFYSRTGMPGTWTEKATPIAIGWTPNQSGFFISNEETTGCTADASFFHYRDDLTPARRTS